MRRPSPPICGKFLYRQALITSTAFISLPAAAMAQDTDTAENDTQTSETNIPDDDNSSEIIVTAQRIRGSVISDIEPVEVLTADDIASYGADSIQDLLTALAPQTGSARGRASGPPIVLINAQRVSGFRELRNIPPEAIIRVEVFPEEVALQYGFRPDQRVINFILKDDFKSINTNLQYGLSTDGGYSTTRNAAGFTKFSKNSRLNLDASYERTSELTEDERDITQEEIASNLVLAGPIAAQDIGAFRTLLPDTDTININGSYSKSLSKTSRVSANLGYTHNDSINFFGLNDPIFTLPDSNVSNDSGSDILIQRFFVEPRPLQSISNSDTIEGGASINSRLGGWIWSSTLDTRYVNSLNRIDQSSDFSALQDQLIANDDLDPFAVSLDPLIGSTNFTTARFETFNIDNDNSLSGTLFNLPNGEVRATISAGYNYNLIDSSSDQTGELINIFLSRNIFFTSSNIDIPITDPTVGVGRILGKISINANSGARNVSNFGTLFQYGYGLTWKPVRDLTLTFTAINQDTPPSLTQLGNPIIVTPNVPIFDFTQSQTSFVALTTGGNPNLEAQRQRDIKISLNYSPEKLSGFSLIADYSRNRSFDTSNNFPLLTPEIEAAFSDRVTRDAAGTLIALDRTPVIFDRVISDRIRYGFNFSKRLGPSRRSSGEPRGRPSGRPSGRPPSVDQNNPQTLDGQPDSKGERPSSTSSKPVDPTEPNGVAASQPDTINTASGRTGAAQNTGRAPPSSARGSGRRGGRRGGRPGRFNISLYHTIALNEQILISPQIAELDLLNGSAIGANGGAARHSVELEGGLFNNGFGTRVSGNFSSATTVTGNILTGASDLRFGSLATVNVRFFYNLGSKERITNKLPFLKGSRVSINIQNIGNAIQRISDQNGDVPRNFQRGFVDPRGRFINFNFRKRF